MRVELRLFASLRIGRFETAGLELPEGETVAGALEAQGLKRGEVAIIFVNSRHADFDTPLREGDALALFPPIGGG